MQKGGHIVNKSSKVVNKKITYNDRIIIENLIKNGAWQKNIAMVIGCSDQTMSREVHRGGGRENYSADIAQRNAGLPREEWRYE